MRNTSPDIYELVEALKATVKRQVTKAQGYENDMVFEVSIWNEKEIDQLKAAILELIKNN
jgi:hypothetical protein